MAYLFRLILLCVPLLGVVAVTAEAQRIDRSNNIEETSAVVPVESEIVLALNVVAPTLQEATATDAVVVDQVLTSSEVVSGAGAGLPICLALVLLVTLIRQRTE